jgi:hypothetical protein
MMPQKVGGSTLLDEKYLDSNWHKNLTAEQLDAYLRYCFISLKTKNYNSASRDHTTPRKNWDGGVNSFGTRFKRIWSKISKGVRHVNANPGIWVSAHFSPAFHAVRVAENKGFIDNRPELLVNPLSVDIYENYLATFDALTLARCQSAEISIATQLRVLEDIIKDEDDRLLYVLADGTNVNATPFFRYAFAVFGSCPRAASRYEMPAVVEYEMNQPLYDKLAAVPENNWWLSDELREKVIEIRKGWCEYDF